MALSLTPKVGLRINLGKLEGYFYAHYQKAKTKDN